MKDLLMTRKAEVTIAHAQTKEPELEAPNLNCRNGKN